MPLRGDAIARLAVEDRGHTAAEVSTMSIVARFRPRGLTCEKYDETLRQLKETGVKFPPDGLEYHLCFGSGANLSVSEVWSSRMQMEAFHERLVPVLYDVGVEASRQAETFEVHNSVPGESMPLWSSEPTEAS
jgi:hypothetical protein